MHWVEGIPTYMLVFSAIALGEVLPILPSEWPYTSRTLHVDTLEKDRLLFETDLIAGSDKRLDQ